MTFEGVKKEGRKLGCEWLEKPACGQCIALFPLHSNHCVSASIRNFAYGYETLWHNKHISRCAVRGACATRCGTNRYSCDSFRKGGRLLCGCGNQKR